MVSATIELCGHMFCERCIFEWHLFNKDCPICRKAVRDEPSYPCPMMNALVESYLQQPSMKKELDAFLDKKQRIEFWKQSKMYYYSDII